MKKRFIATFALFFILCLGAKAFAFAHHHGAAFAIISERQVGPCMVSVWGQADVGTDPFFVMVNPAPGQRVPDDLKVELALEPVDGHIAQKRYATVSDASDGMVHYKTDVALDAAGQWRVHVLLHSSQGTSEAAEAFTAATPGYGAWDLLLYAIPFLAVGMLWFGAVVRRRNLIAAQTQKGAACS